MNIVFDIGNVLVAWEPHAAFRHAYASDAEIDAAFAQYGFYAWNAEQDRGRNRAEGVAAMAPDWANMVEAYFDRFHLTITRKITGTWDVMEDLRIRGHRIFGLSNWGVETWPAALDRHPELPQVFEDLVLSCDVGLIKPEREIYDTLCHRNDLAGDECFFIDDSQINIDGARAAGWQAHHFTGVDALKQDLSERGLL